MLNLFPYSYDSLKYLYGNGTKQDYKLAYKYFKLSYEYGNKFSINYMAVIHDYNDRYDKAHILYNITANVFY
jgi:TPR repeat protein